MSDFLDEYQTLQIRSKRVQVGLTTAKKARWVARDKARLEEFVQKLVSLVAKLNDLLPSSEGVLEGMTHENFTSLGALHVGTICEASEHMNSRMYTFAKSFPNERCQERIVDLMWFRTMDERKELINAPENGTYGQILEPPSRDDNWDGLSQWPCQGQEAIYVHRRTHDLLQEWAGNLILHAPNFFFWHLGTDEQMSQGGLCTALLYQILQVNRPLIKRILPDMWRHLYRSEAAAYPIPSPAQMPKVFDLFCDPADAFQSSKYCFYVDGLVEYSGRYQAAVQFIELLSKLPNVKTLASTRPEPGFADGFCGCPMLKLKVLTRTDIKNYVEHKIEDHPHMARLLAQGPAEARGIITKLVDKASGVSSGCSCTSIRAQRVRCVWSDV
ncbi:uncharacterized protein A1O9_06341 [Exophiala aquamarina CBS 119918]|uniref:Prion-inhibition and propagation HeLo domain-containing protein n=1 Tax=Exophiala aquamarina CBS 119918 TaxID=1182545 RepID=A0A072PSC6_9EURO|nr:uncharacterized protein A1O9_06341 [Exophiala aquamarina CBS 119918]KEF58415.1 hypothetical protein A1O9_06341 [Exophiala aquamarina CBS 119918]